MPFLASLSVLKARLNITGADDDATLTRALEEADAGIAQFCNRPLGFATQTVTETQDGTGAGELWLTYTPVTAITSISTIDGSGSATVTAASTYTHESHTGYVYLLNSEGTSWPKGRRNIRAVYVGGYADTASVPYDLAQVALSLAAELWFGRARDGAMQSEQLGGYSYSLLSSGTDTGHGGWLTHSAMRSMIYPYVRRVAP